MTIPGTHQIMICSYVKDFPWLKHNLRSLKRFCKGFLPPLVSVHYTDFQAARALADEVYPETFVCIKNGPNGNLRAQISMMSGDLLCPHADYVYLLGSDCIVWDEMRPDQWFKDGKPHMLYTSYKVMGKDNVPWQRGTETALNFPLVEHEFMRRLPLVYPKNLFPAVRRHMEKVHGMTFEAYVYKHCRPGVFSESNIMGAFAFKYMPDLYTWTLTDNGFEKQPHPLVQFWSHGGLDRQETEAVVDFEWNDAAGNRIKDNSVGKTPRSTIEKILGSC